MQPDQPTNIPCPKCGEGYLVAVFDRQKPAPFLLVCRDCGLSREGKEEERAQFI